MVIVTNQDEFKNAITNMEPEIVISKDIHLSTPTNIGYAVNIKGEPGVSLFWTGASISKPMMLTVTATGNLSIESLTLDGEGRNGTLVHVNGGKFTMNDGTILKNIYSRSSRNAVRVGDLVSSNGGTFNMNGGLITGVDSSDAVFCGGGTVVMDNDAAISGNMSAGITMLDSNDIRSSLTMAGRSRISNNQSRQGASAGIIMGTDIIMGVKEGDAPCVTGNHDPLFAVGGWLLTDNSTLTMRCDSEISGNDSVGYGGGLAVNSSTLSMYDNAVIKNNKASFGAGLILSNSTISMEAQAQIFGNVSSGRSGGLELQSGSALQMKGNAAIHGNTAVTGAGIYLNRNTSASINLSDSSSGIYDNQATGQGGGIFISTTSTVDLLGQTCIKDNIAAQGKGIYKVGTLNLSQSPLIQDGLFFDDLNAIDVSDLSLTQPFDVPPVINFLVPLDSPKNVSINVPITANTQERDVAQIKDTLTASAALQQAYSDNVPIIVDTLKDNAHIQLESSEYVSPQNVPLVIANKGTGYAQLGEADRAAWRIPSDFGAGYTAILNPELNQVLIDLVDFRITYHNLFGAENPNPDSYRTSDLPIKLSNPGRRQGYIFAGWYDADGKPVTEIPVGTTGDLSFTATWEKLLLEFDGNASRVCNVPKSIHVEQGSEAIIPSTIPARTCYEFIGWNMPSSGSGKIYFPGDAILISDKSVRLYAQWHRDGCCNDRRYRYYY